MQGIGRALSEAVVIQDGHIVNPSLTTYLMPLAPDIPAIENVLIEVPTDDGPFGARAVAEPPGFGPPAAIANAIEDAVGVRLEEPPLSAITSYVLCKESHRQRTLGPCPAESRGAGGPIE